MDLIKISYKNKKGENMLKVFDFITLTNQTRNEATGYNYGHKLESELVVLLMFHIDLKGLSKRGVVHEVKVS